MTDIIVERLENLNLALAIVTAVLGGLILYLVIWIKDLSKTTHDLEEKVEGIEFEKTVKDFL